MQNVEFSANRKIPIENAKRWGKCGVVEFSENNYLVVWKWLGQI
jgi:hypothetical protein